MHDLPTHATYNTVLSGIFVAGVVTFPALLWFDAPFGRFSRKGWGPKIPGKLAWMIFETVPVWAVPYFALKYGVRWNRTTVALLGLWETHYIHRGIIFPFLAPSKAASNIPIILSGITYNLFNAFLQGYSLATTPYPPLYLTTPTFLLGTLLFFTGLSINIYSDYHLFHLRRLVSSPSTSSKEKINENDMITTGEGHHYVIPKQGLFKSVSCPNYFGEILEWIGWAVACGATGAGWSFAFYTVANLMPRAIKTHRWYQSTFGDRYPKDRKALFPGVI
ncbi:hypothetical protein HK097_010013 [Rhizophlyctis rosea]|uniref:3-oxo-5-alpha-steroid 4-dehydrogenase C-terminal domain-containing protein n=1 Tax=Rhizophlyctis rosea TaxID=64517 RepID=A0AAD5SKK9_9FUNG|nr:hypothetical protein HK097_010013 [Rhizophlyctis rosea]